MKSHKVSEITVRRAAFGSIHDGLLTAGNQAYRCKLGAAGITTRKAEGDGATPAGRFGIIGGFFRRDRINLANYPILTRPITENMGWCDDPGSPQYNRLVMLPFSGSHEVMFRDDSLYDICLVLDYNYRCRHSNAGSAIFFHLADPFRRATRGCIGLDSASMLRLLPRLSPKSVINIVA